MKTREENLVTAPLRERDEIPKAKRKRGDVRGLYAVELCDGKTTVYIRDGRKRTEIKEKYERHLGY